MGEAILKLSEDLQKVLDGYWVSRFCTTKQMTDLSSEDGIQAEGGLLQDPERAGPRHGLRQVGDYLELPVDLSHTVQRKQVRPDHPRCDRDSGTKIRHKFLAPRT